jgi:alkanesulfonate monooxygenase SsuD/methylene tetrahydromethanopterin reductase-like flavin-dependent oxidoreductase (luciferase family)
MRVGVILPQGWFGEFEGWDPIVAYDRVLAIAQLCQELGFESIWTGEHVQSKWGGEQVLFDCVTLTTALAQAVPKIGIGFLVLNSTFRNPALTAKTASTIDVVSRGRLTLGLGAGFREDEYKAFGYDFPPIRERLAMLGDHLEIISRMVTYGEPAVTFEGRYARVEGVINNPRGVQRPRIPLMIGGHGPNITYRLAARYCNEINIDLMIEDLPEGLVALHQRCEEEGRDPSTLALSAGIGPSMQWRGLRTTGGQRMMEAHEAAFVDPEKMKRLPSRVEALEQWRDLGFSRVMAGAPGLVNTDETLHELKEDCVEAGVDFS